MDVKELKEVKKIFEKYSNKGLTSRCYCAIMYT